MIVTIWCPWVSRLMRRCEIWERRRSGVKVTRKRPKAKILIFLLAKGFGRCWVWSFRKVTEFRRILKIYPPGNDHISPFKGPFKDVFSFPKVGYYVSSLEGKWWFHIFLNIFSAGGRFKSFQKNPTGEGTTRTWNDFDVVEFQQTTFISWLKLHPIGSMYGIFTYIYQKNQPFM